MTEPTPGTPDQPNDHDTLTYEAAPGAAGTSPTAASAAPGPAVTGNGAEGGGRGQGPGTRVISIAPGTRTAVRALLIIGACLVLLVPVGLAGGLGVVSGIGVHGEAKESLPAEMKKLSVKGGDFNLDVQVDNGLDEPRIEADYLGGNPNEPAIDVTTGDDREQVDVNLTRDGATRLFGNLSASATLLLPADLAKNLSLEMTSDYGEVSVNGNMGEGNWTGEPDSSGWARNGNEDSPTTKSDIYTTQQFADLKLYSETGGVSAEAVSAASADLASKSGDVSAAGKFKTLQAKTSAGDIRFNAAVSDRARAVSTDGSIGGDMGSWRPYAQPATGVDVQSYAGDVNLKVPRSGDTGEKGQKFKGYRVAVPKGTGTSNLRVAAESGSDTIPLHAESTTGNVTVAYSDPAKGGK